MPLIAHRRVASISQHSINNNNHNDNTAVISTSIRIHSTPPAHDTTPLPLFQPLLLTSSQHSLLKVQPSAVESSTVSDFYLHPSLMSAVQHNEIKSLCVARRHANSNKAPALFYVTRVSPDSLKQIQKESIALEHAQINSHLFLSHASALSSALDQMENSFDSDLEEKEVKVSEGEVDLLCTICQSRDMNEPCFSPCAHLACKDCWLDWLKENYNKCPECESVVDEQQLTTVRLCVICNRALITKQTFKTECSHELHRDCLQTWLKENPSCPVCQFEMPSSVLKTDDM